MARSSKKQKRSVISRRRRLFQIFCFNFEKSSFVLRKIHKLSVAYEKYDRNPRRVGRKRSIHWCDHDMQEMEDAEFISNFRLSRPSFAKLCNQSRPLIMKEETFAKNTVSVERRVAMTLYFLGQGINYGTVANQFGVAVPTVCRIVHETTKAIVDSLAPEYIKFPESDAEYLAAMATFQGKPTPNCIGAIDRSHITVGSCAPQNAGLIFIIGRDTTPFSSKGSVMAMGNFWVLAVGSIHDARMLRRSGFNKKVLNKRWILKSLLFSTARVYINFRILPNSLSCLHQVM